MQEYIVVGGVSLDRRQNGEHHDQHQRRRGQARHFRASRLHGSELRRRPLVRFSCWLAANFSTATNICATRSRSASFELLACGDALAHWHRTGSPAHGCKLQSSNRLGWNPSSSSPSSNINSNRQQRHRRAVHIQQVACIIRVSQIGSDMNTGITRSCSEQPRLYVSCSSQQSVTA